MRGGWVACLATGMLLMGVSPPAPARAESCYFSDLSWSEPGRLLLFQAGEATSPSTLQLDLTSGTVTCLTPRVGEPSWDAVNRRVLWRDAFGIYSLDVERPGTKPRQLVFLPEASSHFLRATGNDAHGALLLWTLDRNTGEHRIWVRRGNDIDSLPGSRDGGEMLRQWTQRNVAVPFDHAGGQFVRSLCVQKEEKRLCLEQYSQARRSPTPLFRVVLGGPRRLDIVVDRSVPTEVAVATDSSRIVFGLLEEVDGDGESEVFSTWVSNFESATRLYETLLPARIAAARRHRGWVFWTSRRDLFWCDAAGQLAHVTTAPGAATILVTSSMASRRALERVVALTSSDRDVTTEAQRGLEAAGFDVGLREGAAGLEVQAGVFVDPQAAEDRAEALRRRGFPEARVVEGGVQDVAPGLAVSVLDAPGGERIVVRHRRVGQDLFGEIWLQTSTGEERLLLPAFDDVAPTSLLDGP